MMRLFGRRLYGQIIGPLLIAAVVVAVLASLVAVFFLGKLTDSWVSQVAEGATGNLADRFDSQAEQMTAVSRIMAEDVRLLDAIESQDPQRLVAALVSMNVSLAYDNLALVDSNGRIVATTGLPDIVAGQRLLDSRQLSVSYLMAPRRLFLDYGGRYTLTALQPVSSNGRFAYSLAATRLIDESFLREMTSGSADAFFFYDSSYDRVAGSFNEEVDPASLNALSRVVAAGDPAILEALTAADRDQPGVRTLRVNGTNYQVWARQTVLEGNPITENTGYLVGFISQEVSDRAGATTINLIMLWSAIAIVVLALLGNWIARSVSEPLARLATGASRVADGDFSMRVKVGGSNEVACLAESFNRMTESLEQHTDSLTKKVLELSALYEMSRSLSGTLEMDDLLQSVLETARRMFNVELGYIALRDRDRGALEVVATQGLVEPDGEGALRSSMSEWVVAEGRPLIYNPPSDSSEPGTVEGITGAMAALCVPLISSDGPIGAVMVGSREPDARFSSDDVRLLSTIANQVAVAIGNIELFQSLQHAYLATVRSLAAAVDAKDPYTRGHSDQVAHLSVRIAERMRLAPEQRVAIEMAAYLHDIGKIGIRGDILLKPGKLTDEEMAQMRHHPLIGANILKPVAFPWTIVPIVRHHHEQWSGAGYPAGLKGEEIPLLARILSVADAYDAMTSDRPYRRGRTVEEAVAELQRCSGTQFDPRIVDVFVSVIRDLETDREMAALEVKLDPEIEEARAVFVALCDGMFSSFRHLGGPKLALNVESQVNTWFEAESLPFRIEGGRMRILDGHALDLETAEVDLMRVAVKRIDDVMGGVSGASLVDHFYADALESLSDRMKRFARDLGFCEVR